MATNGEVSALQDFLQSRGYLNSEPTGFFGLLTQKAVMSFQTANGFSPTGYVGPLTKGAIQRITCGTNDSHYYQPTTIQPDSVTGCPSGAMHNFVTGASCGEFGKSATTQASIKVISPNGGEQLALGEKTVDFRTLWTSSNLIGNVTIYLNLLDGRTCKIATVPVSQGSYAVAIGTNYQCPNIPTIITSGQYKVLLAADNGNPYADPAARDSSDNYFKIISADPSPVRLPTVDLKVNDSDGPITVAPGSVINTSWTSTNATSCVRTGKAGGSDPWYNTNVSANGTFSFSIYNTELLQVQCSNLAGQMAYDNVTVNVAPVVATTKLPSVSIDQYSLTSYSSMPIITGNAWNILQPFGISISSQGGDKVWASGNITVTSNVWSSRVTQALPNGVYLVQVYSNNILLTSGTLNVVASSTPGTQ